ncbi:AraC-like DNA-binding protein [Saccharopolyspora lacisalsi]|uniref:AraC-like DNA-binding protein n=1 Tax=Halosaccharopolyspora lacisalsi TaxID=1000566 RepID=A0A839DTD3_9PSEU|nr:AraC family transcriptional regulator [Halosaccharopolyspora lacisalsi]MBA8824764.1 AraC-like DNA-binding protein [Halosaccharopolyspora lacisalsi]
MEPLTSLLSGARARGAFVLRTVQSPPWSVHVRDSAPLSVVTVARGAPWVVPDAGDPVLLDSGDIAMMRGPDPFTFTDDLRTPVDVIIHPGPRRTTAAGAQLHTTADNGVRTWVNGVGPAGADVDGSSMLLIGKYREPSEIAAWLLSALPPLLVIPKEFHAESALVSLFAQEIARDEPGQDLVLDRLLDLLVVAVLRAWFTRPDAAAPAWYQAHGDPVVGPALRLIHGDPSHPWTVNALARRTAVSRATLARRFTNLVGTPPIAYLTDWRLDLAADLLSNTEAPIESIAHQVGYNNAFALSAAFKRSRGVSPQQHRMSSSRSAPRTTPD